MKHTLPSKIVKRPQFHPQIQPWLISDCVIFFVFLFSLFFFQGSPHFLHFQNASRGQDLDRILNDCDVKLPKTKIISSKMNLHDPEFCLAAFPVTKSKSAKTIAYDSEPHLVHTPWPHSNTQQNNKITIHDWTAHLGFPLLIQQLFLKWVIIVKPISPVLSHTPWLCSMTSLFSTFDS